MVKKVKVNYSIYIMKTLTFNVYNEQEELVLIAFLNSVQYDYRPVEEQNHFSILSGRNNWYVTNETRLS